MLYLQSGQKSTMRRCPVGPGTTLKSFAIFVEFSFLFCFSLTRLVYLCTFVYVSLFLATCPTQQCNMQFTYDIIIGLGPKSWFRFCVRDFLSIKATSTEVTRCSQFLDYPVPLLCTNQQSTIKMKYIALVSPQRLPGLSVQKDYPVYSCIFRPYSCACWL